MDRRIFLSAIASVLAIGPAYHLINRYFLDREGEGSVEHYVLVVNYSGGPYTSRVDIEMLGNEEKYGPEVVEQDETWEVTQIKKEGDLFVQFFNENTLIAKDTHKIPITKHGRSSFTQIIVRGEDVEINVMEEH